MKSRLTLIILLVITSTFIINCRKTDVGLQKVDAEEKVTAAQQWFVTYQKKTVFNSYFKNAMFLWDHATTFTFSNGNEAIAVPVFEKNQNLKYRGKRVMYLYPWKNKKGYYPVVYELIPSLQSSLKNKGALNLKQFDGIVNSWTLTDGFRNGALYKNGIPEKRVEIKSIGSQQLALQPVTVYSIIPSPSGIYNIYYTIGNISNTLSWSGYGENPCEYGGCDQTDLSAYFNDSWFRSLYEKLINQLFEDEIKDSTNKPCPGSVIAQFTLIGDFLPDALRVFFGSDPTVSLTFRSGLNNNVTYDNNGDMLTAPPGGWTQFNVNTTDYQITLNEYYNDITDLGMAATIIHETMHAQLLEYYRLAILNGDTATQRNLAENYGPIFGVPEGMSNLEAIVNGGNAAQHSFMVDYFRGIVAGGIYAFALSKGLTDVTPEYCYDLALTGATSSVAFGKLSSNERSRIQDVVNAEKDPNGNNVNLHNASAKGKNCK